MKKFVSRILNKFCKKYFYTNRLLESYRYEKKQKDIENALIVFQMGKVGSSTIVRSLKHADNQFNIYQIHVLTHEWIKKVEKQYRDASKIHGKVLIDEDLLASMYLRKIIDKKTVTKKFKVITLIRDPIARNISSFFQAFSIYFPNEARQFKINKTKFEDNLDLLIDIFLNEFERHDVPLLWFDVHMKPSFDIDVYKSDFDPSIGYKIYHGKTADLLLLRLEDLDKCAEKAFKMFLNIDKFELEYTNISKEKEYGYAYGQFKNKIILPREYIDKIYHSKFVKHFYTEDEVQIFKTRWSNNEKNSA